MTGSFASSESSELGKRKKSEKKKKEEVRRENKSRKKEQEKHGFNKEEEVEAETKNVQEGKEESTLLNSVKMAENREKGKRKPQKETKKIEKMVV